MKDFSIPTSILFDPLLYSQVNIFNIVVDFFWSGINWGVLKFSFKF